MKYSLLLLSLTFLLASNTIFGQFLKTETPDFSLQNQINISRSGELDPTFGINGRVETGFGFGEEYVNATAIQTDGKILVAGTVESYRGYKAAVFRYNSDGSLDNGFGKNGVVKFNIEGISIAIAVQIDGKILVGIKSDSTFIVRLNYNGTFDNNFGNYGMVNSPSADFGQAKAMILLNNGKIIVVGLYNRLQKPNLAIFRFNSDGSLDESFGNNGVFLFVSRNNRNPLLNFYGVKSVIEDPDGKIVVLGTFGYNTNQGVLFRIIPNGQLDVTFNNTGILKLDSSPMNLIQKNGKFYLGFNTPDGPMFSRLNSDGSIDNSFGINGKVTINSDGYFNYFMVQSDNKIVAGGSSDIGKVIRVNPDGLLDSTFGRMGIALIKEGNYLHFWGCSMITQPDKKIVLVGNSFIFREGNPGITVARLNPHGTMDSSFNGSGITHQPNTSTENQAHSIAVQSDGKIIVAGGAYASYNTNWTYSNSFSVTRYNADGTLDNSFGNGGINLTHVRPHPYGDGYEMAFDVAIQTDDKILVLGIFNIGHSYHGFQIALIRYNSDGSLDSSFDGDGIVTTDLNYAYNLFGYSLCIQQDGKIVVVGSITDNPAPSVLVVRFNTNGSFDTSFDNDGIVKTNLGISFPIAQSVVIQPDGKILVLASENGSSEPYFVLLRYNTDGTLDNFFNSNRQPLNRINDGDLGSPRTDRPSRISLVLQNDGKILVAKGNKIGLQNNFSVTRFNSDGLIDVTFGTNGTVNTKFGDNNSMPNSILVQPDGKIVVAGLVGTFPNSDFAVSRYNNDGSPDETFWTEESLRKFGTAGKVTIDFGYDDVARDVALQSDGKIVVAGHADGLFGVVRLQP